MEWNCRGWEAWHDHMPGRPATLHVSGECEMPTPGYTLTLTPAEPQGINPDDLILVLTATEPTDFQTEVLTWNPVKYEQETEYEYKTVSIRDVETGIPVKELET